MFIEVTSATAGTAGLINLDRIQNIHTDEKGDTVIVYRFNERVIVKESYEVVKDLIKKVSEIGEIKKLPQEELPF